jgi:hypothetical protein
MFVQDALTCLKNTDLTHHQRQLVQILHDHSGNCISSLINNRKQRYLERTNKMNDVSLQSAIEHDLPPVSVSDTRHTMLVLVVRLSCTHAVRTSTWQIPPEVGSIRLIHVCLLRVPHGIINFYPRRDPCEEPTACGQQDPCASMC